MMNFQILAIPITCVVLGLVGGACITLYHLWDKRKTEAARRSVQKAHQVNRIKASAGCQIVEAVDTNNDFPKFGENLTSSFARMRQLNVMLNSDLKGCATSGEQ